MTILGEVPLTWRHALRDGLLTVVVDGTLTMASSEVLHEAITGLLRQNAGRLLVDLSGMVVADEDAVQVFAAMVAQALPYPEVPVVVCAPTVEVMRLLSAGVLDLRLVFGSVAAGRTAALADVPTVAEDLLPVTGAARRSRDVVTEACLRWAEPDLIGPATLVASELVTNAAMHAHTLMTMQVRLLPCHLRIAVFDGSDLPAVTRAAGPCGGGRGLHLVEAVSAAWGSTALPGGKVVWAALSRGSS